MMKSHLKIACLALLMIISGCKEFLDVKPSSKLAVPNTLRDLQALLDHPTSFTGNDFGSTAESSTTEYYLLKKDLDALQGFERNVYSWALADVSPLRTNDWSILYKHIFTSTSVLENLNNIERSATNAKEWDNIKGQAHFIRAKMMFNGAQTWCLAYSNSYAATESGMVIRVDSDFNKISKRSTLKQTFDYILADAVAATNLLATKESFITRANKAAAYALLARIHLYMGDAPAALTAAESALSLKSELLDYNTLNPAATYPITQFNKEILFYHHMNASITNTSNAKIRVVQELYNMYENSDLRKVLYFRTNADGTIGFKGSYTGSNGNFSGMAIDEVYLIAAECYAKAERLQDAALWLNRLLITRFKAGSYVPKVFATKREALNVIYQERRKTLLFRSIRWGDVKRLNRDGENITLTRDIEGTILTLPPNHRRYAIPLPEEVISLSEIVQNTY